MGNGYTNRTCSVGLPPDDKPKQKPQDKIDIIIGVFFDGTKNNKYNVFYGKKHPQKVAEWKEEESHDSYGSEYTNVVHLWNAYPKNRAIFIDKVYIEGVGSAEPEMDYKSSHRDEDGYVSTGKDDSGYDSGTGMGFTGVNFKIENACKMIRSKVKKMINRTNNSKIKTLTLDVFGFSRGAASARSFVSRLSGRNGWTETNGRNVWLISHLSDIPGLQIKVRFLGLFDTVSSFGFNFNDDVDDLALSIPTNVVNKTVHIVAADEYRKNFALTNIASADRKGTEVILPGAHSDIGGGYVQEEKEYLYMGIMPSGYVVENLPRFRGYWTLKHLHNRKWINDALYEYALEQYWNKNHFKPYNRPYRRVLNTYARIPLKIMYNFTVGIISYMELEKIQRATLIDNKYPNLIKLGKLLETMATQGKNIYVMNKNGIHFKGGKTMETLILSVRAKFIHLSAHNQTVGFFIYPHEANDKNKRKIIEG